LFAERKIAVHLLRKGEKVANVASELNRSEVWVRKWWKRYRQEGYRGLQDRSRAPKNHRSKLAEEVVTKVCLARSELESERELGIGLKYIGALAVRTRLKEWKITPLPSKASIERILRAHNLTSKKETKEEEKIKYPHLQPKQAQELVQVDIVPHYLTGERNLLALMQSMWFLVIPQDLPIKNDGHKMPATFYFMFGRRWVSPLIPKLIMKVALVEDIHIPMFWAK
jgi:transposase